MRGLSDRAELTKLRNHMTAPSVVNSAATQPLLKTPLDKVLLLYLGSRRPPGKATGARAQAADALTQRLARARNRHTEVARYSAATVSIRSTADSALKTLSTFYNMSICQHMGQRIKTQKC